MAGVIRGIRKGASKASVKAAKTRANRPLSAEELNAQVDVLLQREGSTAVKEVEPQTPLEILRKQLLQDERQRASRIEAKAQKIVNTDAAVQNNILSESKRAAKVKAGVKADAKVEQQQATKLEQQQLSEASANGGSFADQIAKDVDQSRAAREAAVAAEKAANKKIGAAVVGAAAVAVPLAVVDNPLLDTGTSSLTTASHVVASIKNGQLVDASGKPIENLDALQENNQISITQPVDSLDKQVDTTSTSRDVTVHPNGKEITINGRTIDREAVQRDNGITIITAEEAKANNYPNPNNSDLIYISGNSTPIPFASPVDGKTQAITSLPKSISGLSVDIVNKQKVLEDEAKRRAIDSISQDPVIQQIFGGFAGLSKVEQAKINNSLRTHRNKVTLDELNKMKKEPAFAAQFDEITLLNQKKGKLISVDAALGSAPEEVSIVSQMYPQSVGHPQFQLQLLTNKDVKARVFQFQLDGMVKGIDKLTDKGQREAAINLAVRTATGREDINQSLGKIILNAGNEAEIKTRSDLTGLQAQLAGTAKERQAAAIGIYQKNFQSALGDRMGSVLLSSADIPPELSQAILNKGIQDPEAVISELLGGKPMDDNSAADILNLAKALQGADVRVRQFISTQNIIASAGINATLLMANITRFANNMVALASPVLHNGTLNLDAARVAPITRFDQI